MSAAGPRIPLVIGDSHLHATADGVVVVRVRGDGPAVVTVRSARPLTARWLRAGRARLVRLGEQRVSLPHSGTATIAFQLDDERFALLRRMQIMRTTISVTTAAGVCRRRVYLHAPQHPRRAAPRS